MCRGGPPYQWDEQGRLRGCNVMDCTGVHMGSVAHHRHTPLNENQLLALEVTQNSVQHMPAGGGVRLHYVAISTQLFQVKFSDAASQDALKI